MNVVTVLTNQVEAVVTDNTGLIISVLTPGPQGAQGLMGPQGPAGLPLNDSAKVDKSVVYYDATSASYRADATLTTSTLTDGGNF